MEHIAMKIAPHENKRETFSFYINVMEVFGLNF